MENKSPKIKDYFERIDKEVNVLLKKAISCRELGYDPEDKVDIPIASNMAERVLGLISDIAPKLKDSNIVQRIMELEEKYAPLDWRVGFVIGGEVAKQKFCTFESKKEALEIGIRTGFTYLTGGIVSAPLEGFVGVSIKQRKDGKEYIAPVYAGPIRGAGGTAAATSVVLTDYVASQLGYAKYDPSEEEINRVVTELTDYHGRITNLQYFPSEEEIKFMFSHLPVEVDGEPTERIEVSNHKDLSRIETNLIRGGICLVIGEGLCQKAPKLWKRLGKWGKDLGIDWDFLDEFLKIQKKVKAKGKSKSDKSKLSPNYTFINDMVAGRPVISYPMRFGGFRLRMGRTRTSGFSAIALNPITLDVLRNFIVYGTQLKLERPGKAGSVTLCDSIEGPTVLLKNGDVIRPKKDLKNIVKNIEKILFLGDILINYGDFSENGHSLVPLGYCNEWWSLELRKKILDELNISVEDNDKGNDGTDFDKNQILEYLNSIFDNGISKKIVSIVFDNIFLSPSLGESAEISYKLGVSLHPNYTFYYSGMSFDDLKYLVSKLNDFEIKYKQDDGSDNEDSGSIFSFDYANKYLNLYSLIIKGDDRLKSIFEKIGLQHEFPSSESIVIKGDDARAFALTFCLLNKKQDVEKLFTDNNLIDNDSGIVDAISKLSNFIIKDKAGTFVGARMGRPEKAKMRKLQGSPHMLFPLGEEGGKMKSLHIAAENGSITTNFPLYYCSKCKKRCISKTCHICESKTIRMYHIPKLNKDYLENNFPADMEDEKISYNNVTINVKEHIDSCLKMMKCKVYPDLIKGVKVTSNKDHIPENMIKGFLRAKHDIYVNKDGTTRYDMSEAPITAFKPCEIDTSVDRLKELGYTTDMDGNPLVSSEQVVELFPQDIIVPSGKDSIEEQADDIIIRISNFVDDLLKYLYKKNPHYKFKNKEDISGVLVVCLAPHTSCGTIGRIIGFSKNQVMLAHPMMHAAMRRDCDGDEACFMLLMDAFLNFSRQYLPNKRGSRTMDAPLVLSTNIIPSEVDDQVHGVDVVKEYPLELYEGGNELKMPWDVDVEQLSDRLHTPKQYEDFWHTHPVSDINIGQKISSYKTLPSMAEKLAEQMNLAKEIRAVDESNVAEMVIQKHFLKDIKGNLRKFSTQQFRCVGCNRKFYRPPLLGKCTGCGGKLIFTISEGSIIKYLGPSIKLATKYDVDPYLRQTIELTSDRVDSVFGKEKEVQEGLGKFFSK